MSGPILYSTNPWYATQLTEKYRYGIYEVWVCEVFDSKSAPPGSAAALIAPSSNPREIYERLKYDCENEDRNSSLIKNYRRAFTTLARSWLADGSISDE